MTHTIEQLEAMIAGATDGPWKVFKSEYGDFVMCARGYPAICERPDASENVPLAAAAPTLATELIAALKREAQLREALEKAREDFNWMLNNAKPLNSFVFDYIDAALATEPAP